MNKAIHCYLCCRPTGLARYITGDTLVHSCISCVPAAACCYHAHAAFHSNASWEWSSESQQIEPSTHFNWPALFAQLWWHMYDGFFCASDAALSETLARGPGHYLLSGMMVHGWHCLYAGGACNWRCTTNRMVCILMVIYMCGCSSTGIDCLQGT